MWPSGTTYCEFDNVKVPVKKRGGDSNGRRLLFLAGAVLLSECGCCVGMNPGVRVLGAQFYSLLGVGSASLLIGGVPLQSGLIPD